MTNPPKPDDSPHKKTAKPADPKPDFSDNPLSDKIGKSLRSMYDDVAKEPVPDAFLALLAKADEKTSK